MFVYRLKYRIQPGFLDEAQCRDVVDEELHAVPRSVNDEEVANCIAWLADKPIAPPVATSYWQD